MTYSYDLHDDRLDGDNSNTDDDDCQFFTPYDNDDDRDSDLKELDGEE